LSINKFAFIAPGKIPEFAVQEPLNLGFMAAWLERRGIEVKIIDELAGHDVESDLREFKPDMAGITGVTALAPDAYRVAAIARKLGITTVMGGNHASILPNEARKHVDIVVVGEGERALDKILDDGIKDGIVSEPFIKNLDEIPPVARHLLDMEFYSKTKSRNPMSYLAFVGRDELAGAVLTSRGCPFNCTFCHNSGRGLPYRFHSAKRVIGELKMLINDYGIKHIFFIEDNLFANRKRLKEICRLIKEEGLNFSWGGNARVDNIWEEDLDIAREAGCKQITFGFESGSQKILDVLNKGTTVEQAYAAARLTKSKGIIVNGTFMIGNPTETLEDIRMTQEFIKSKVVDLIGICITTPYPGTALWEWCKERGRIPKKPDWSMFVYSTMPVKIIDDLSRKELMEVYQETMDMANESVKVGVERVLKVFLKNPAHAIKRIGDYLRKPEMIEKFIKRLEL